MKEKKSRVYIAEFLSTNDTKKMLNDKNIKVLSTNYASGFWWITYKLK